jgi:hypothetical protein
MMMTEDPKTKILAAVQTQIDFIEQLARCYAAAAVAFPQRAEFFTSTSMAKQTCANLLANMQKDYGENQEQYHLERDASGLFINLGQKNRQNLTLLEAHKIKDSEFLQYSRAVEIVLVDNVAGPIIVGMTPTFLKLNAILHKIQQDQIRLFDGFIRMRQINHGTKTVSAG